MTATFALSLATKFFLGGALAAGIAIPVLVRVYGPNPQAVVDSTPRGGGWLRESSAPAGAKQPRQLILYRPSLDSTDCRLEFTWNLSGRPLGWTFRAKDKDNYYGMAIRAMRPAPYTALSVEHFTVYHGIESPHSSKVLILSENSPAIEIRMDVTGATFQLHLAGKAADRWTDSRLSSGGVGFLEQPDQPADVQSVRISLPHAGGA